MPQMAEVTALGCALAAGLGVGAIKDEKALKQLHSEHKMYQIYDSRVGCHPESNNDATSLQAARLLLIQRPKFIAFERADQRKGKT